MASLVPNITSTSQPEGRKNMEGKDLSFPFKTRFRNLPQHSCSQSTIYHKIENSFICSLQSPGIRYRTEKTGVLQSMRLQRVRRDWATEQQQHQVLMTFSQNVSPILRFSSSSLPWPSHDGWTGCVMKCLHPSGFSTPGWTAPCILPWKHTKKGVSAVSGPPLM